MASKSSPSSMPPRPDPAKAYGGVGRPGLPPERMLKALLLRAIDSIPSETRLIEAIEFNLRRRRFVDLPPDEPAWTREAFGLSRERFIERGPAGSSSIASPPRRWTARS